LNKRTYVIISDGLHQLWNVEEQHLRWGFLEGPHGTLGRQGVGRELAREIRQAHQRRDVAPGQCMA